MAIDISNLKRRFKAIADTAGPLLTGPSAEARMPGTKRFAASNTVTTPVTASRIAAAARIPKLED